MLYFDVFCYKEHDGGWTTFVQKTNDVVFCKCDTTDNFELTTITKIRGYQFLRSQFVTEILEFLNVKASFPLIYLPEEVARSSFLSRTLI